MTTYELAVAGEPKPQPRVKAANMGRIGARIVTPRTADAWKAAVATAARVKIDAPLAGPVEVEIWVYSPRPGRLKKKSSPVGVLRNSAHVGDIDNFAKAVLDALNGIAFKDDRQVTDLTVHKRYTAIGARPGARITISGDEPEPTLAGGSS